MSSLHIDLPAIPEHTKQKPKTKDFTLNDERSKKPVVSQVFLPARTFWRSSQGARLRTNRGDETSEADIRASAGPGSVSMQIPGGVGPTLGLKPGS